MKDIKNTRRSSTAPSPVVGSDAAGFYPSPAELRETLFRIMKSAKVADLRVFEAINLLTNTTSQAIKLHLTSISKELAVLVHPDVAALQKKLAKKINEEVSCLYASRQIEQKFIARCRSGGTVVGIDPDSLSVHAMLRWMDRRCLPQVLAEAEVDYDVRLDESAFLKDHVIIVSRHFRDVRQMNRTAKRIRASFTPTPKDVEPLAANPIAQDNREVQS